MTDDERGSNFLAHLDPPLFSAKVYHGGKVTTVVFIVTVVYGFHGKATCSLCEKEREGEIKTEILRLASRCVT